MACRTMELERFPQVSEHLRNIPADISSDNQRSVINRKFFALKNNNFGSITKHSDVVQNISQEETLAVEKISETSKPTYSNDSQELKNLNNVVSVGELITRIIKPENYERLALVRSRLENISESLKILNWYNFEHIMILPDNKEGFRTLDKYLLQALENLAVSNPVEFAELEKQLRVVQKQVEIIQVENSATDRSLEKINLVMNRLVVLRQAIRHIKAPMHVPPPKMKGYRFKEDNVIIENIVNDREVQEFLRQLVILNDKEAYIFVAQHADSKALARLIDILEHPGVSSREMFGKFHSIPYFVIAAAIIVLFKYDYYATVFFQPKNLPEAVHTDSHKAHGDNKTVLGDGSEDSGKIINQTSISQQYLQLLKTGATKPSSHSETPHH